MPGSMIHLIINLELKMIFQNISKTVVGDVLNSISPLNISLTLLLPSRFNNCQAAFGRF